jgi:hypothetical protein
MTTRPCPSAASPGEPGILPAALRLPLGAADPLELVLTTYPELCDGKVLRLSVLVLLADVVGGFRAQASLNSGDSMVTRDLTIRARRPSRRPPCGRRPARSPPDAPAR